MSIETNSQYMEGQWAGKRMVDNIEKTMYETIENAITVKEELITHFENNLGFSKEMEVLDSNYAYNLGMLNILKENNG